MINPLKIKSNSYYLIRWIPKDEGRVVTGAFIRGHLNKCELLCEEGFQSEILLRRYLESIK